MVVHASPHPGRIDPDEIRPWFDALGPLMKKLWPSSITGLEHFPASDDRVLVVGNHSGMGSAELMTLSMRWFEQFGTTRPIAGMAHRAAFLVPPLRSVLHALGAVEATREGAAIAIRAGVPLLLFPGGDHEAARPLWQSTVVDFRDRTGWVRLAREHQLSIVPLCITGSHVTLPIVARGKLAAWITGIRFLGARRGPLPVLSIVASALTWHLARNLSLPVRALLSWAAMPATMMIPWVPSRLGFHLLPRISADEIASSSDRAIYDRVVGALQTRLTQGSREVRDEVGLQSQQVDASSRP